MPTTTENTKTPINAANVEGNTDTKPETPVDAETCENAVADAADAIADMAEAFTDSQINAFRVNGARKKALALKKGAKARIMAKAEAEGSRYATKAVDLRIAARLARVTLR